MVTDHAQHPRGVSKRIWVTAVLAVLLTGAGGAVAALVSSELWFGGRSPASTSHGPDTRDGATAHPSPSGARAGVHTYAGSLTVPLPEDLDPLPAVSPACRAAADRALTPAGVRAENALPGTGTWQPSLDRRAHWPVQIYLDSGSTSCGGRVGVHLGGHGGVVRLRAYRVGWYGSSGARLVWQSQPIVAPTREVETDPAASSGSDRRITLDWPVTASLTIPPSWTPGFYLIAAVPEGATSGQVAPLVVRADAAASPLLFLAGDTTWQAYNGMGGASQYGGRHADEETEFDDRAYTVAVNRPLIGTGLQQLATMDLPLVRYLARHGLPVGFTTTTEADAHPSTLLNHNGLIVPGHSEYWTTRLYDGVEAARNAGVNIAFLGGNQVYWHLRIERDLAGRAVTQTVYRQAALDPLAASDPLAATVRWTDPPLRRDQSQLTGSRFSGVSVYGPSRVMHADSWLLRGTGLTEGAVIARMAGNEVNSARPGAPTAADPPNVDVVLQGMFSGRGTFNSPTFTTSYYSVPSGAGVFDAGTTYWACHVDNTCPDQPIGPATLRVVDRITLNVAQAFAQPRAGATYPSLSRPAVSATELKTLFGTAPIAGRIAPGN
ncbi:MAG: hypothetical protein IPK24_00135 [Kineosporiaceae bacterium]|nr:hypothetical protein [Kineosporiaceae bacterium]